MNKRFLSYVKLGIYVFSLCAIYGISGGMDFYKRDCEDAIRCEEADNAVIKNEMKNETKRVAITFDDGPHCVYTEQLLDGLKERNVVATFFVVGASINDNEALIERMSKEGHLIGNHTYNHVQLSCLATDARYKEIDKTNETIESITGKSVGFLRPPFGSCDEDKIMHDMMVVMWDIDPLDWCTNDVNKVVERIVSSVEDGDIILMHDIFETSVKAALKVIDMLKEQGYEFVTVEELIM